ncbi:MAG: patatin-like phospholipase family protein, partial [Acidimicrobiales bacterium]
MARMLDRLTRWRDVAFVLSGGGNLGAMQVGMLKALAERGIVADQVLGCSVGALNGAAYAADPTADGVAALEEAWLGLSDEELMPSGWIPRSVQMARKGESLHDNEGLRSLTESVIGPRRFDELDVPFQCVATRIADAAEVWFSDGVLIPAILASAALPAVYPAVEIDGHGHIDGGVVNDVPITRAVELGYRRISRRDAAVRSGHELAFHHNEAGADLFVELHWGWQGSASPANRFAVSGDEFLDDLCDITVSGYHRPTRFANL